MWPFREKPDDLPPSDSALAVAKSLENDPARWAIASETDIIVHDMGIAIDTTQNWICQPWFKDNRDSDRALIEQAVQKWIAARVMLPPDANNERSNA